MHQRVQRNRPVPGLCPRGERSVHVAAGALVDEGAQTGSTQTDAVPRGGSWEDAVSFLPPTQDAGRGPCQALGSRPAAPSCWVTRSLAPLGLRLHFSSRELRPCSWGLLGPALGDTGGLQGLWSRGPSATVTAAKAQVPCNDGLITDVPLPGSVASARVDGTRLWVGGKVPETKRLCHGGLGQDCSVLS